MASCDGGGSRPVPLDARRLRYSGFPARRKHDPLPSVPLRKQPSPRFSDSLLAARPGSCGKGAAHPDASSHPQSHCQRLSREHPDRQLRLRFPPRDFRRSRPERHPDHRRRRTTANIVRRGGPIRTGSRTMALRSWPSMPPSPTSLSRSRFPSWDWPSGTLNTAAARSGRNHRGAASGLSHTARVTASRSSYQPGSFPQAPQLF
jgi:hypothetical protein